MTRTIKNMEQKWVARSCMKGSRIRKAMTPPKDEILLEPLRGVLNNE